MASCAVTVVVGATVLVVVGVDGTGVMTTVCGVGSVTTAGDI
jgi:hypothetical protein